MPNIQIVRENSLGLNRGIYADWMGNALSDANANALLAEGSAVSVLYKQPFVSGVLTDPQSAHPDITGVVASTGSGTLLDPNASAILTYASLPKFKKKLASGEGARVGILGDSTTVGAGAGATAPYYLADAAAKSPSAQLAKLFSDAGCYATDSYLGGSHLITTPPISVPYATYDTRFAAINGAAPIADGAQTTLGGLLWTLNSAEAAIQWTPVENIDSVTVYYTTNSTAQYEVGFTPTSGSRTVIGTINTAPPASIGKETFTFAPSTGTIDVTRVSGTCRVLGIEPWNSTANAVRILNFGQYGDRLESGGGPANNTNVWRGGDLIRLMQLDLVVVDMAINSAVTGIGQLPAYKLALTKVCEDVIASGAELVLAVPHALGSVAETTGVMAQFRQAIHDESALRKCPVINLYNAMKDYQTSLARGLLTDNLHQSEAGYTVKSKVYYGTLGLK